jgi:PPP family 3-phenylpropionic acid transporter
MPYWRLSGFYFFYFAVLGTLAPYWGLYLKSVGFTALQIGNLIAILMISRIVAPNIWGWLADHRGQSIAVVRWAGFLSLLAFAGVFLGTSFWWLALVMLVFSFFWNASLPQIEAATMSHFDGEASAYGKVRLWGSVGFILAVAGLGYMLEIVPTWWVLPVIAILLAGVWLFTLVLPESQVEVKHEQLPPLLKVLLKPQILVFLLACFLMQASHGPYYTFYSIYLEEHHYGRDVIGLLWALGVICEIGLFLLMHKIKQRIGLRTIMLASFSIAVLRWYLIGMFADDIYILIFAQVLHAVTFGAYHATSIELVHRFFKGRHQIRGQAIYGSISFGLGGALGSFYSGITWNTLGADVTFFIAAACALVALGITWLWIKPEAQPAA